MYQGAIAKTATLRDFVINSQPSASKLGIPGLIHQEILMKTKISVYLIVVMLLAVLGATVGCNKAPNDAQITSDIQNKMNADSGLAGKQVQIQAASGTVTLSGTVDNESQREAAARYASAVPGVKQVVNNLSVAPALADNNSMMSMQAAQEETKPAPVEKPRASKPKSHTSASSSSTTAMSSTPEAMSAAPSTTSTPAATVPATPPPPQKVTIPSGTTLAIRLVDTIDSETAQQGQTFHATLDSPLSVDGDVAIPSGYDVEGHVVEVQSAGKFAGRSVLKLQLDRIAVGSKYYSIQTDQYARQGSSRGKNTAAKVGAGAAIGAIIGGIAGGGKGAGIGAAAGGGLGGGVQAATKGQQIKLASETVLNFTLQSSLTVIPTTKSAHDNRSQN
jgi:hypothetical protein